MSSKGEFFWNGHAPDYRNGVGCCTTCGYYRWSITFVCLYCNPPEVIKFEKPKRKRKKKINNKEAERIRRYMEAMEDNDE
jgi:hypothetical protein